MSNVIPFHRNEVFDFRDRDQSERNTKQRTCRNCKKLQRRNVLILEGLCPKCWRDQETKRRFKARAKKRREHLKALLRSKQL